MTCLEVNPAWRSFLETHALRRTEDFLRMPAVIICGHPDRNVSRVTLGTSEPVRAFLKKEHSVRWRDRLANAWAGYGFCSRSCREMGMFHQLRAAGIACPEVIAAGEHQGNAFVLVRAVDDAVDLGSALQQASVPERRRLARKLGTELAGIHAAGFDQPDLYSKHVLVETRGGGCRFWFLDWQRSRQRRYLPWSVRCRDLAALDATLTEDMATDSERLACLRSYLSFFEKAGERRPQLLRQLAHRIRRSARRFLRRRHIQEVRHAPLRPEEQNLIWLEHGEAVCVTPEFQTEMGTRLPGWIDLFRAPLPPGTRVDRRTIPLAHDRSAYLVRRRETGFWHRLWSWLRRKRMTSAELEQAGTLFRLQRHGIPSPRLLAVGQCEVRAWRAESFLLTDSAPGRIDLLDWLGQSRHPEERRRVLQQAGDLLRRLHRAGYHFDRLVNPRCVFAVQAGDQAQVWLTSVEGLRRSRRARRQRALRDLRRLRACISPRCSEMELRWLSFAYSGSPDDQCAKSAEPVS